MRIAIHSEGELPAKLRRPSSEGLISRPRLFALLDAFRRGRLIWIHGPAGAGKTSLVSSWIASKGLTGLWYQLDSADDDPVTFFHLLGRAVQGAELGNFAFPASPPADESGLAAFVQPWVQRFNETLPRPAVIVLDNYQALADDARLHAVINSMLGALAPGIAVIVVSRSAPPPALAAWISDADFHLLDWEQLRLTTTEAGALARSRGCSDTASIDEWLARARGWVAGFVLFLLARERGVTASEAAVGAQHSIFELLATQIFERLPRIEQERLALCALPTVISSATALAIAGEEAPEHLRALHGARLFVDCRMDAKGVKHYEFHPLMRAFLASRGAAILGLERIAAARRVLATLLEREGDTAEAIAQWTELAAWSEVVRVVAEHAPALLAQGRHRALEHWIDRLPVAVVEASGWLSYWRGVARGMANPVHGRIDVERAYGTFIASDEPIGALLAAAEVLNQAFLARADYTGIDAWLDRIERLYGATEAQLAPSIEATIIASMHVCGDIGASHPLWERIRRRIDTVMTAVPDHHLAARVATLGVVHSLCRGDILRARRYRQQSDTALGDPDLPAAARIAALSAGIAVDVFDGRHAKALENANRIEALIASHGQPMVAVEAIGAMCHAALGVGDIDRATRFLTPQSSLTLGDGARAHMDMLRALTLSGRGEGEAAIEAMRAPIASLTRIGARFVVLNARIQLGQALWHAGCNAEARAELLWALSEAGALNAAHLAYLARLGLAACSIDNDDMTQGIEHLREALSSGRRHDYLNAYPLWLPDAIAKLLAVALQHDIEPDHVRRFILQRNLQPPSPDVHGWPWPIRVYTLGRFALFIGEHRFDHGRKAQRRVLDLLKVIIAMGGVGVGREQIATSLWPDSDGPGALNALEVTLHRLRKLLGRDDAIRLEHGEVSLDRAIVWVDTLAFESLAIAAGRTAAANGAIEDSAHAAEQAMRLYYGPFLRFDDPSPWTLTYQERLRNQYRRLAMLLARHWPASRAIEVLERAIEIDPAAEALHRRLMTLLAEAGREAEAVEAYQRCDRVLRATLGVPPSAETRAALQRLSVARPAKGGASARAGTHWQPGEDIGRAHQGRA